MPVIRCAQLSSNRVAQLCDQLLDAGGALQRARYAHEERRGDLRKIVPAVSASTRINALITFVAEPYGVLDQRPLVRPFQLNSALAVQFFLENLSQRRVLHSLQIRDQFACRSQCDDAFFEELFDLLTNLFPSAITVGRSHCCEWLIRRPGSLNGIEANALIRANVNGNPA